MARAYIAWAKHWPCALLLSGMLASGCATAVAPVPELPSLPLLATAAPHPEPRLPPADVTPVESGPELPGEALTLDRLVALAAAQNPDLAAAWARAEMARGRLVQAGLYPNPVLSWAASDLDHHHSAAGKQGPLVQQQIVTAGKLRLDQAAAREGVAAADWQALTRWYDVVTRIRLAYFELAAAHRDVAANEQDVRIAEEGLSVARRLQQAGVGTQPDVLRALVDRDQNQIQLAVAQQRLHTAWRQLAVAVGVPALPPGEPASDLEAAAPRYEWEPVRQAVLERSSEIQDARAAVRQAEAQLRRALVENVPNLQLQAQPYYDFIEQDAQYFFQAGAMLPIFNKNQGNILAARANLARAREEVRLAELRLTDRLAVAFQRYQAAREQVETYRERILPNAAESLRLVRLGYERGDPKYDYTSVLQAQRILVQARLAYVQVLGELWRGVSEIAGLLQQDQLDAFPCSPR